MTKKVAIDIVARDKTKAALSGVSKGINRLKGQVFNLRNAFAGLGIDNVIVEVDDMEVPIMDGSASPFVFLIQSAGIKQQSKPKKFIKSVFISSTMGISYRVGAK